MKQAALALLSVIALGGAAAAQVPAPDFWIDPVFVQPSGALLEFRVQGPPNCPAAIYSSPDEPGTGAGPRRIRNFARLQLDGAGNGAFTVPIQWQGPLPDVWFGCVLFPPAQPALRANVVHLAGAFAFALVPDSACVLDYTAGTGRLDVDVQTTPSTTVSIWEVDCPDAPTVGAPFNTAPASVHWVHSGNSDATGAFHWSGTRAVTRCLVVMANGVVIGVMRSH